MGEDAVADGSEDPGTDTGPPHLSDLAQRVAARGEVHVVVDGVAMVCLTAAAHERLRPAGPPGTTDLTRTTAATDTDGPAASTHPAVPTVTLDPTQRRILHLIHRGLTASEVADVLEVDLRTLTHHLGGIRGTYGVTSTREAVRRAADAGVLPPLD